MYQLHTDRAEDLVLTFYMIGQFLLLEKYNGGIRECIPSK